jgi:holliday junction DNA helicase RuvB
VFALDLYTIAELRQIIAQSAARLGVLIEDQALTVLAERSRGTPRTPALHPQAVACGACVANRLLRRARDLAQVREVDLTGDIASETMRLLRVGELGLEAYDLKYMTTMLTVYAHQPVGPQSTPALEPQAVSCGASVSAATGIPVVTITNHIEPCLMKAGLLRRTRQGRELTEQGQALIRTQGRITTGFEDEPD